jgi:hypothetical protein
VLVRGTVAAPDVAAGKTEAKMNPLTTDL